MVREGFSSRQVKLTITKGISSRRETLGFGLGCVIFVRFKSFSSGKFWRRKKRVENLIIRAREKLKKGELYL